VPKGDSVGCPLAAYHGFENWSRISQRRASFRAVDGRGRDRLQPSSQKF
jgi:hypothetical protein